MPSFGAKSGRGDLPRAQPRASTRGIRPAIKLVAFALLLGAAHYAHAGTVTCSQFGGVIDGNDPATYAIIASTSTLSIDENCLIENWPQDNGLGGFPITNINFNFPQQASYYIVFDNVYYPGLMSCNNPTQSTFWIYWAPGGYNNISSSCQAFMVPVDAVVKQNPPSQTTAAIGVPFTYTITAPYLGQLDSTGTFNYVGTADSSDIANVVITDDLTQGNTAALSYVSNTAYLVDTTTGTKTVLNGGLPLVLGASSTWLSNHPGILSDSTKHLVFSYENNPALAKIPAGYHIEIDLTVVLDNNTTANYPGEAFTNTVNAWFDKTINSTAMTNLQMWPSTTPPMTIVAPNLTLTKTSPSTTINIGAPTNFTLNIQNVGGGDAWNTTITDNIPAGMCIYDPRPTVTARIFAADGVTPVSGLLVNGTDFSLTWNGGTSSACQLTATMLTSVAKIGPTQRLIINYQAEIDSTGITSGTTLTNVAGATQWFDADGSYTSRYEYDKTLTNGTPGVLDFQDAYTLTAALAGYYFQKTVQDLTSGASPATTAYAGDRLRYTLLLQNFTWPSLNNITISDVLPAGDFDPSTLTLVSALPGGATATVDNINGSITISGLTLPGGVNTNSQIEIQFDVTLASNLANGTNVLNQASLTGTDSTGTAWTGVSDDPYINGTVLLNSGGDPTPVLIQTPGALSKQSPTPGTATIGQQFSYLITVPATPVNMPLYDVQIQDTLPANVSFVSAQTVSGGTWNLTNTGTATSLNIQDTNTGIDIPANGQAVIQVTVALQDMTANTSGVSFTNTASYTYDKLNGDSTTQGTGAAGTSTAMTVVEPHLTVTKAVSYVSPAGQSSTTPAAPGNVLQYTVTVTNSGTSEAFDADVMDFLPPNVSLVSGSATATISGSAVSGFNATPIFLPNGVVDWGNQNGDGSLDIPVGGTLVLTYQVSVLEVNGAPIINNVWVDWTSLDGAFTGERTGAGCPSTTSPDNYCTGPASASVSSLDPTAIAKSVVSDTWITAPSTSSDGTLRVGDTVVFNLALTLREGVTDNVVVTDQLPTGLAFDSTIGISPSSGSNFTYTVASQPAAGSTGTVSWNLGSISNAVDNNSSNNTLTIQFRARVLKNTLAQTPTAQMLTNNAALSYSISGVTATPKTSGATMNVWQPLLGVSKSAAPAGGGTVLTPNEVVTYTVNIQNTGNAPAYDTVLQDTIPVGMRTAGITMVSVSLVNAGIALPNLTPTYNAATGVAVWNFDSGVANQYAIPPGDTLRVVYSVATDPTLGAGMTLSNQAQVQLYYSFDSADVPPNSVLSDRQVYGPTGTAVTTLTTAAPTALSKQGLVTTAALGQPFVYRITIPATPQPTAIYDVQVLDDISLATTGVSLSYLGASAHLASNTKTWASLTNTGTATNLVLVDTANGGLDIPANDQLVVDVTLVLTNDTVNNTVGKQFTNTATYKYNSINGDNSTVANGSPGASGPITIVGPNLTMVKSGPATMRLGVPGSFTLNVQNTGGATAWNEVITDILPNITTTPSGGMCSTAPTGVTAGIYQSDGTTLVTTLVSGTDYTVSFAGAPSCTLTLTMLTAAAAIAPGNRLIISYSTSLDPGTAVNLALTNIAGATQYLSANPTVAGAAGNVHTYTNSLTDGTPTILDFQDAWTVTTEAPVLTFTKSVFDVTTGQSGTNARPGDILQYTLTIANTSPVDATNFTLTDDLDNLNNPAMFVPGSLKLITVPAGANTSLTSATGGSKGTGEVVISGLNAYAQGSANSTVTIVYQVQLVPVINNGTVVLNQAQITATTLTTQLSDDPNTGVAGDPTHTLIASAPVFQVLKTSQDITSGTSVVMAGDTLRYTITVKNIGSENATGVTLTDQIPSFTTYVAGSTRLNGTVVADPSTGVSALQNGMLINAPGNTTPGVMLADATSTTTNVATITFDVKINANVIDGTIISNQGFVSGSGSASGPFATKPSDDPNTPTLNDPTRNIVGNLPLLTAVKTVVLQVDSNGNGAADPGDVLRYTITISNSGAAAATGVKLADAIPVNTTYVGGSTTLNGATVTDPALNVSALQNGMPVNSPGSGAGTIAMGGSATITFDVAIIGGVVGGTVISNQGMVTSTQLSSLLTDADGNPSNGDQPTTIVVGSSQQLAISKSVSVVGGGAALPGSTLEYTVTVTNTGTVPATSVVITDDLTPLLGEATYVSNSATLNGSAAGVSYAAPVLTANYSAIYGSLAPGVTATLRFQVLISSSTTSGTLTNTAQVAWNTPTVTASASASVDIGAIPGTATLSGRLWHDANFNKVYDSGELVLAGWKVDLYRNGVYLGTTTSDVNGQYQFSGLAPTLTASDQYQIRFSAPGATATTAKLGLADSVFTNGLQQISDITAGSGSYVQNLNLPITPDGVVYNSVSRTPIAGATVTVYLLQNGTRTLPAASCFDDAAQQNQVTLAQGYYKFDINFSDASCPAGGQYLIQVTPPATGYVPGTSVVIPPATSAATSPYDVPTCPADALPTVSYCEAQTSGSAPPLSVAAGSPGTVYYLHVTLNNGQIPGQSQLFNNHIPVDPVLTGAVAITKTTPMVNVTRSQMVPYTITIRNTMSVLLTNLVVVDTLPPGFKYVEGSGRYDGSKVEPVRNARVLRWENLTLMPNEQHTIRLLAVVGSGVSEGEYVNQAQMITTLTGGYASGLATAAVRVVPDPTFDCTDIIGKVFDDANLNGFQDRNEKGLAGVRVVSARGLIMKTDEYGRFHVTCPAVPNELRGSNFILKLDERSLPSGYRLTTDNPLVHRLTRGKIVKFNFGATIHRVVSLDVADGVFEPGASTMRPQWVPRLDLLLEELRKGPAVLRLSYLADVEDAGLVKARMDALRREVSRRWAALNCCYRLNIESETFWRRGAPVERKSLGR